MHDNLNGMERRSLFSFSTVLLMLCFGWAKVYSICLTRNVGALVGSCERVILYVR